ncbi:MAG: hypothetical protein RMK19_03165 [Bacteroidia bacterium]|nr:hypothetical protein [Bacteroidia bacterium]MDW8014992.1 hypothetical protein [Bacteroidia bacterium]
MRTWLYWCVLLGMGCKSSSSSPQESLTLFSDTLRGLSPCQELRLRLQPFFPPFTLPPTQSLDPFPPHLQDWLKQHLQPNGVYAPVGRWSGHASRELWLIELISAEGAFFYAVLAETTCKVLDTMLWAYQQVYPDRLEQAQVTIHRDGICKGRSESRITSFKGDEPRTTTALREYEYQVDWAAGKLRSL